MTADEILAFGDGIAAAIIQENVDSTTDAELARLTILVAFQLLLMGQLYAEDAGLDVLTVYREEFKRTSAWHERTIAEAAAFPQA